MNGKDDIVVGCITNYGLDAIRPWVNSLDRCGFSGHKLVLGYNVSAHVVNELRTRGYTVMAAGRELPDGELVFDVPFSIVVERFFHIWQVLKERKGKHRFLIHTDVKDVIFQKNPSSFLEELLSTANFKINASSESIRYEHEIWGRENFRASFGEVMYEHQKREIIVNAGTLSGEFNTMLDLFLVVYQIAAGAATENADQAALNLLLSCSPFKEITVMTTPHDAWACQAGTTNDPGRIEKYRGDLCSPADADSYLDSFGNIRNSRDEVFHLVHQYDRVPAWKSALTAKYAD